MQVLDDILLLERMMEELNNCGELYRPTNYWAHYEKFFLPELRKKGLKDFRRRRNSILSSFGATDLLITGKVRVKPSFRGAGRITTILNLLFDRLPFLALDVSEINPSSVTPYFYQYVKAKYDKIGLDLAKCPTSQFGNPEDLAKIDDGLWSLSHLQYCSMFIDAAEYLDFKPDSVVCELGPGMGRNIEIMAHLFNEATFFLFDIPPQLYVANQYLQKVFGPRVIPYSDAISLKPDKRGCIPEEIKGKIIIQPTWRMPDWSTTKIDIFWNSASFQEMEPNIVLNYLNLVVNMEPEWIYINALPQGNYWGNWKPGGGGTKAPVLDSYYREGLNNLYTLHYIYNTDYFLRTEDYKSYILKKGLTP